MLSIYDLYDLSAIFKSIRAFPVYEMNEQVVLTVIDVLNNLNPSNSINQLRVALRSLKSLDQEIYYFINVDNLYVYFPPFLKDEGIYQILLECCTCLLEAIREKNIEKIEALSECVHNLPIFIANNKMSIPSSFWSHEVNHYRRNWDSQFLKKQQFNYCLKEMI